MDVGTAPRYSVALVMIARDEAPRIQRAIASLRPFVDACWVLDTGSRDDTPRLAAEAGARVAHFGWVDDFSAARNAALDLARADWHLVLDADEWLEAGGAALQALCGQAPDFVGQLRVESDQDGGGACGSWISRLLPGHVRYAGRVHEQPVHRLPVRPLDVRIGHAGYLGAALATKTGRNAALLQRSLAERPDDAYLWYQLGKDHDAYGRHADALPCFAQSLDRLAGARPAWLHDLAVRRLHALKHCGRHAEGLQWAENELPHWSGSPDFHFALGDLLLDWAAEQPQHATELLPLIESAWQHCLQLGEHPELEGAVAGRGGHLAAHNLALLYDTLDRREAAQALRVQHALRTLPAGRPGDLSR